MQLAPSPQLANIIKHYLILESDHNRQLNYRLFSDGNPGVVFYFKTLLMQYTSDHLKVHTHPRSFIYGQLTQYQDLVSTGRLSMLVIVLQPYGIYALSRIAAAELNDSVVNLNELFGIDATWLEEQVLSAIDTKSRINFIESFLFKKLASVHYPDKVLIGALKMISYHKGNISVANLLDVLPVTERQLERKFKDYIGISPKRFTDTVRLQHFLKLLQNHPPNLKVADAVYEGGYYDQAHLNNYFKRSIGITPSQYKSSTLLAINFMQTPKLF